MLLIKVKGLILVPNYHTSNMYLKVENSSTFLDLCTGWKSGHFHTLNALSIRKEPVVPIG
jgi:hypothetical protein